MPESDAVVAARTELETAVKRWLKVKAAEEEPTADPDDADLMVTSDPILLGWVTIAIYTSMELERAEATASAFECGDNQAAPFSRGIAMAGVDRWANR